MILNRMKFCLVSSMLLCIFAASNVSAEEQYTSRTEWGSRDISYESNGEYPSYHRTLSGATWYYYEIPKNIGYSDDKMLYVPFDGDANTDRVAVPAKTCQRYGGFWVLLRNGYNGRDAEGNPILTGPAAAVKLSDIYDTSSGLVGQTNHIIYKNRGEGEVSNSDSNDNGVKAKYYGTMNQVKGVFEFFKSGDTTAVPANIDWVNTSNLSYFCAGDPKGADGGKFIPSGEENEASFVSFSTVTMAGADNIENTSAPVIGEDGKVGKGYLSSSLVLPAGAQRTIIFRHYIAKSVENNLDGNINIPYSINSTPSNIAPSQPSSNITDVNKTKRFRINGTNYYATVIENSTTITVGSSAATYCQAVTFENSSKYNLTNFKITGGGKSSSSSACVTIKPISGSPSKVSSCTQGGGSNYVHNERLGNTAATVGLSKNGELKLTPAGRGDSSKNTIAFYAKPEDVIQFSYGLCFGAHDVGGIDGHVTVNKKRKNTSNIIWNIFNVSVGEQSNDSADDNEYLFEEPSSDLFGQDIYVVGWDTQRASKMKNGEYEYDFDYKTFVQEGSIDSPISEESAEYFTLERSERQILFASPSEGYKVINSGLGVVGATLSQTLTYNNLAVWTRCLSTEDKGENSECFESGETDLGNNYRLDIASAGNYDNALTKYNNGYKFLPKKLDGKTRKEKYLYNDDVVKKTAKVITPYNFDTNVWAEMDGYSDGTVKPGDKITVSANIDILPRVNPLTSSKNQDGALVPYATSTHSNTRVDVIELLIRDTVDINNPSEYYYNDGEKERKATIKDILNGDVEPFGKSSICNMYRGYLGDDLGECSYTTVKGNSEALNGTSLKVVGNANNNSAGEMSYFSTDKDNEKIERIVPDVEAGYKYCIGIGINHGDSHNLSGKDLSSNEYSSQAANSYSVSSGLNGAVKPSWKVSKMSCRTITKEPNFQVWNGGVYSSGNIETSVASKNVNTKLTSNNPTASDSKQKLTPSSYFGSWAEYFVVSKGSVKGFASASALGYTTPYPFTPKNDGDDTAYFAANGLESYDFCKSSYLTIANISCQTGTAGKYADVDADNTALESYKDRIINYYTNPELKSGDIGVILGGKQSDIYPGFEYAKQNRADYLKVLGNYTIDSPIIRDFGEGTLVIEVEGNLSIEQNICLGSGTCKDTSYNIDNWKNDYEKTTNYLSLTYDNSTSTDQGNIASIPQVILIAENITISSEVSQIDAWLITNSRKGDSNGGFINTCKEFKNGETGSDTCWKTLKINGPVITTALFLNRTGGAWTGFSGDVGNPAYDNLYKEMQDYIVYMTDQIMANPAANINIYREAASYCAIWKDYTGCMKQKITILVKADFLAGKGSDEEQRAYKYSGNFSAEKHSVAANSSASRDLTCDGSITPAEIFDLNPIVYLWALAESQKSNQAIITYAQEFSPRY